MMSDAFYNRMAATASKLLDKFGGEVTVSRTTGGSINPVTGVVTPGATTTLKAKGLITDFAQGQPGIISNVSAGNLDGAAINQSDRLLILDNSFEPLITDRPVIGSQQWNIVEIVTKKPSAVAVVYMLRVRK